MDVFFKETIAFKLGSESYRWGAEVHNNCKLKDKSYILGLSIIDTEN